MIQILHICVGNDLRYPDNKKNKVFPFCPENEVSPQDKFTYQMNEMKPNNSTQN